MQGSPVSELHVLRPAPCVLHPIIITHPNPYPIMSDLASKKCVPCKGGVPPLEGQALADLQVSLGGGWEVVDGHYLSKRYTFDDFAGALVFTDRIGIWHGGKSV